MQHTFDRAATPRILIFVLAAMLAGFAPSCRDRYRTIDGSDNHPHDVELGAAHTQLRRAVDSDYGDGVASLAGETRPSPREISNIVCAQPDSLANPLGASDFLWQWGQFLDHDLDLTGGAAPAEPEPIVIPVGDPFFDPFATGGEIMEFNRSVHDLDTGTDADNPRQQINEITHWIDASNVYGSDDERAAGLRTLDGTGKLRTSEGDLLPFNTTGLPNDGGDSPDLFVAGDFRANEQVGLTAMHTLFVREHNRLAEEIAERNPRLDGEQIYQRARKTVGALMQVITYEEFLPALLGPRALRRYRGYRPWVDPRIQNIFSTAIYRFGHSALSPTLLRLDASGAEIAEGHLPLRDAFFSPHRITDEGGIEPLLRGLAAQACQITDARIIDDVRNFLFGPPGAGGFDLASLNIQRGRDHGLPSYNSTREQLGLGAVSSFSEVSSDPATQQALEDAYGTVDSIDLWVGALSEDPVNGGHLGELASHVIATQFEALRDADRYWYELTYRGRKQRELRRTRLADVIRRNTDIGAEISDDVFHVK